AGADVADTLAAAALLAVAHVGAVLRRRLVAGFVRRLRFGRLLGRRFLGLFGHLLARNVGAERRPLAVAVFAHRQQIPFRVGDDHADHVIAFGQVDAFDAASIAAHGAGLGLVEADRHALA